MNGASRQKTNIILLMALNVAIPVFVLLLWHNRQLGPPASAHGAGIDAMLNYLLLTVGLMLVAGHVVLAVFLWRSSHRDRIAGRMVSEKTEWKWAILPLVLMTFVAEGGVMVIGLPVWKQLYAHDEPGNSLVVEVMGEQFAWSFRYAGADNTFGALDSQYIDDENVFGIDPDDGNGADDIVVSGELRVPVDVPLRLRMRTKDVLHSLFLPRHRVKQDLVPGMVVDTRFTPTETGQFEILCTELCGLGHYQMRGILEVVTAESFEGWLNEMVDDDW